MMPVSTTSGTSCSDRQDSQVVWRKQELLKIFPDESREKIENASQQNDLTSAINYLLDNQYHVDNDDVGKCG